jgi:hypothetical protein
VRFGVVWRCEVLVRSGEVWSGVEKGRLGVR